jgi:hypothetical protein
MSLAKSPALTPADLHAALRAALVDVSENACFVFAETCDSAKFATLADQVAAADNGRAESSRAWLKASVTFTGAFAGAVEVALPERLGASLVASMLNLAPDQALAEPQMFDGVGEYANMVCGAWLSSLANRSMFELRVPAVTRMAAEWNPMTEPPGRSELVCLMASVNASPVRVRVHAR